ncbi:MAG: glycosyltransferase family 4 protein [bacterium]|nr:glycosyltransferase family 4 protein [bacterium]
MRIAIIGSKGIPCRDGGVERHVEELAVRLTRLGQEVMVYSRKDYTRKTVKNYQGARIVYAPCLPTKNFGAISHTFFSLLHVLFQRADIIHIHSVGPSLLAFIPRIFKRKARVITTFHSRDRFNSKWGRIARFFLTLGEKAIVKFPHSTITVSKNLYGYCLKNYPKSNLFYIPNGAMLIPKQKTKNIEKWGLAENNYILTVARLIPLKGLHYLIRAFGSLPLNKKLVIVGDYPKENKAYYLNLKKLCKNNSRIFFTGYQHGKTLAELFANCYLYVSASEVEGLSLSLLEAMAAGRCTLVSDIPENKEAIGEAGYTFRNKSFVDLAQKILFLNNHPELVLKNGALARERIKNLYNWSKIARQTLALYTKVLTEKPAKTKKEQNRIKPIFASSRDEKSFAPTNNRH